MSTSNIYFKLILYGMCILLCCCTEEVEVKNIIIESDFYKNEIVKIIEVDSSNIKCEAWKSKSFKKIKEIFKTLKPITKEVWSDCYGDWSCFIEGKYVNNNLEQAYYLDAGGWGYININNRIIYYACPFKGKCWNYFLSKETFCDVEGNILEGNMYDPY